MGHRANWMATFAAAATLAAGTATADEAFVEANIIGIFYHELGHALVGILRFPIFEQEEDAVDIFSIFLIAVLF